MRIAALKYRLQLPGFELPETVRTYHREFDERSAQMLDEMADAVEGKAAEEDLTTKRRADSLGLTPETCSPARQVDTVVTLLDKIDRLTASLANQIEMEFRPLETGSST
jgi:hypothetical protein